VIELNEGSLGIVQPTHRFKRHEAGLRDHDSQRSYVVAARLTGLTTIMSPATVYMPSRSFFDRSQLYSDEGPPIGEVAAPWPEAALVVAAWLLRWD
jgi:hypothetical protein